MMISVMVRMGVGELEVVVENGVLCVRAGGVVLAKLMPGAHGFSAIMRRYRKFLVFLASHFCVFKF